MVVRVGKGDELRDLSEKSRREIMVVGSGVMGRKRGEI